MDTVFELFKKYDIKADGNGETEEVRYLIVFPNEVIRVMQLNYNEPDTALYEWFSIDEAIFELKLLVK